MSLDPPQYILSLQNNIRARPISWEGAVRAKTISEADLKRIKSVDKVRKEQRRQTVESGLDGFVTLFFGKDDVPSIFQQAAKRQDIVQYLLVLIGDIIDGIVHPSTLAIAPRIDIGIPDIAVFTQKALSHPSPFTPLLPFLTQSPNPEEPIPLLTSTVLSSLISQGLTLSSNLSKSTESALSSLHNYLSSLAKSSDSGLQEIAVRQFSSLLRSEKSRALFWDHRSQTFEPLASIFKAAAGSTNGASADSAGPASGGASIRSFSTDIGLAGNVSIQLLYHVLLALWQLSFSASTISTTLDQDYDIVPLLTSLLRISPKEKLTRLLLATLRNLLSADANLLPAATTARLPTLLQNLATKHINDDDLQSDLHALRTQLDDYSKSQTTLTQYTDELQSGHLRWSPPHRNPAFWKENARAIFEEQDGARVKQLADVLRKDWTGDAVSVLAVACNDVAALVKECPEYKGRLEKLGLKARVMELMQSADEGVRWEALRCTGEWLRYSFDR